MEAIKRIRDRFKLLGRLLAGMNGPRLSFAGLLAFTFGKRVPPVVGRLDYREDIRMAVASDRDLMRLSSCSKEPETIAWLESTMRDNDVFYDIGANVGAYSLVAARRNPSARIYAFEPSFSSFATLCKNVLLNSFSGNVYPIYGGAGDTEGFLGLSFSSIESGAALHTLDSHAHAGAAAQLSVPVWRIDFLVASKMFPAPTLIKIDVDGGELAVVAGASSTLKAPGVRSVLIELDMSKDGEEVKRLIEQHGFAEQTRHARGKGGAGPAYNVVFQRI